MEKGRSDADIPSTHQPPPCFPEHAINKHPMVAVIPLLGVLVLAAACTTPGTDPHNMNGHAGVPLDADGARSRLPLVFHVG